MSACLDVSLIISRFDHEAFCGPDDAPLFMIGRGRFARQEMTGEFHRIVQDAEDFQGLVSHPVSDHVPG
jgi:hypothetical protein